MCRQHYTNDTHPLQCRVYTTRCNSTPMLLTTDELTGHITGQHTTVNNSLLKVIQGRYCDPVQGVWSTVGVSDRFGSPLHHSTNKETINEQVCKKSVRRSLGRSTRWMACARSQLMNEQLRKG